MEPRRWFQVLWIQSSYSCLVGSARQRTWALTNSKQQQGTLTAARLRDKLSPCFFFFLHSLPFDRGGETRSSFGGDLHDGVRQSLNFIGGTATERLTQLDTFPPLSSPYPRGVKGRGSAKAPLRCGRRSPQGLCSPRGGCKT